MRNVSAQILEMTRRFNPHAKDGKDARDTKDAKPRGSARLLSLRLCREGRFSLRHAAYIVAVAVLLFACPAVQAADDTISIDREAKKIIQVSLTGFSGEVEKVVRFDLEVLGMEISDPGKSDYQVIGNNAGQVEGRLMKGDHLCFNNRYQNASTRGQAHALAQDIVKVIRGTPGIFFSRIVYKDEHEGSAEIGVADFDGYGATLVTHDHALVDGPCWFPGQNKILYSSWRNGAIQIFEQNLGTGDRKVFAANPGANYSPAVSPDGRKVALVLNMRGNPDLYVCDTDGGKPKLIFQQGKDECSSPCWSPDSREICFVLRSGKPALYKISADGGKASRISTAGVGGNLTEPDWSPDGKTIAFTTLGASFSVCIVPAQGGAASVLVEGEDPCWAPNSRTVLFTRRISNSNQHKLLLLDVPTKRVKDVPQILGNCSQPAWAR